LAAALVFIMHLGFASVESGLCQRKNTVNILFKNVFIVCIGALGYMAWGSMRCIPGGKPGFRRISSRSAARLMNGFADEAERAPT
jgi:ammonium transporter, Amt family